MLGHRSCASASPALPNSFLWVISPSCQRGGKCWSAASYPEPSTWPPRQSIAAALLLPPPAAPGPCWGCWVLLGAGLCHVPRGWRVSEGRKTERNARRQRAGLAGPLRDSGTASEAGDAGTPRSPLGCWFNVEIPAYHRGDPHRGDPPLGTGHQGWGSTVPSDAAPSVKVLRAGRWAHGPIRCCTPWCSPRCTRARGGRCRGAHLPRDRDVKCLAQRGGQDAAGGSWEGFRAVL